MSLGYSETDKEVIKRTLNSPPFISVEGVINFRDFGGYEIQSGSPSTQSPSDSIKRGYLFRSGELKGLTETGKQTLTDIGIKKIFDLRAVKEIKAFGSATSDIGGVTIVHSSFPPVDHKEVYDARLKKFITNPEEAFAELYSEILEEGAQPYRVVLEHLRDNPTEPCLIHCTAGKDRTGVIAAIIQMLLGAKDEDITKDYHLTEIGLLPAAPILEERFKKIPLFRDNWEGLIRSGRCEQSTMQNILEVIRKDYGGVEGYVKGHLGMTDEDIATIRGNLLVPNSI